MASANHDGDAAECQPAPKQVQLNFLTFEEYFGNSRMYKFVQTTKRARKKTVTISQAQIPLAQVEEYVRGEEKRCKAKFVHASVSIFPRAFDLHNM